MDFTLGPKKLHSVIDLAASTAQSDIRLHSASQKSSLESRSEKKHATSVEPPKNDRKRQIIPSDTLESSSKFVKLNREQDKPEYAFPNTHLHISKSLADRRSSDHADKLPFISCYHKNELIPFSTLTHRLFVEQTDDRDDGIQRTDVDVVPVFITLPEQKDFMFLQTYGKLSKNLVDLSFFEDLSGGNYEENKTQIGPYVRALTLACATIAYQFGWMTKKDDALSVATLSNIDQKYKTYAFGFAMQHAVYKHRPDMVKFCLGQGGNPLLGQRAEHEIHTGSAIEVACEENNYAIAKLILRSATPSKNILKELFTEDNGWVEIPKPIAEFILKAN